MKCKIDHKDPMSIPKALCHACNPRKFRNAPFVIVEVTQKEDQRIASLEDGFREYFLGEVNAGRANMHWLDEPSVVEYMRAAYNRSRIARAERSDELRQRSPRERKPKVERPTGTFTLAELATINKQHPRIYRAAARNLKSTLEPMQVNGLKYVYLNTDKDKILSLIQKEIDQCKQKPSRKKSSKQSPSKPTVSPSTAKESKPKKATATKAASSRKASRSKSASSSKPKAKKKRT